MRWADLDQLGHVNNVVYVDYLQEARVDLMRAQIAGSRSEGRAEGIVVVRHEVGYRSPLTFSVGPEGASGVDIECWVTEIRAASFTMAYEAFAVEDGVRTTFLRASTVLTPYVFATERPRRITAEERAGLERYLEPEPANRRASPPPVGRATAAHYPVHVRFSDVDAYGHVNNVKYFEYLQEGRIALMSRLWQQLPGDAPYPGMVVAQTDVDYRVPLLFREETYDLWSEVTRVGHTSVTLESEIADDDTVCARAVVTLVFWDRDSGRPAPVPDGLRALLSPAG
ncbi:MAG: thioesterase family protein [Nocardioidaceae bacterium]